MEGKQGQYGLDSKGEKILCPECKDNYIVYNGNYFCDSFFFGCNWGLPHPVIKERDKRICDLLGIDYR